VIKIQISILRFLGMVEVYLTRGRDISLLTISRMFILRSLCIKVRGALFSSIPETDTGHSGLYPRIVCYRIEGLLGGGGGVRLTV
jgi:hypothetical protein